MSVTELRTTTLPATSPITVGLTDTRGRGVFATRDIEAGEPIEQCPVIVVPADDATVICSTVLGHYVYGWDDGAVVIALGYGSLYNHAADPNASYEEGDDAHSIVVRARKPIAAGDEILIDYTGGGTQPLWFDPT